jgi:hypothetical protein
MALDWGRSRSVPDTIAAPFSTEAAPTRAFTVADIASRYRVGKDKVRAWLRRGELRAINVASTLCGKPRWVITPEALAEFERRRAGGPAPKPVPRRKRTEMVDYYPD